MSPSSSRTKRVLLLVGIAVLGVGAFAGLREYRKWKTAAEAETAGQTGRAAMAKEDYEAALDGLGNYIRRVGFDKVDVNDLVLYARARRHIELPNGQHLLDAMSVLRRAVARDSGCVEAANDLLDLYYEVGFNVEALQLIDTRLGEANADVALLRKKYDVLMALRRIPKALAVGKRINELAPNDVPGFFATWNALAVSDTPQKEVEEWVADVVSSHASDVRFELLRAAVMNRRHDAAHAAPILDRLVEATSSSAEPKFVELLVYQLDAAARYEDGLRVLARFDESTDKGLRRELVRRLWYAGRTTEINEHLARWGGTSAVTDAEILAVEALALSSVGKTEEVAPLMQRIANRIDPESKAWHSFLKLVADGEKRPARERVDSLLEIVRAVPDSALLRQALGEAYMSVGEPDLAVESWTAAAVRAPSWSRPLRNMSEVLRGQPGKEIDAIDAAREAVSRSPTDVECVMTFVNAVAANVAKLDADHKRTLVNALMNVRKRAPQFAERLFPIEVAVIASVDMSAAKDRFEAILAADPPPSEGTLLRLAAVSAAGGFPFESRLLDRCEAVHGESPPLAFARAASTAREKGAKAGLDAFDATRAKAKDGGTGVDWDLTRVSFREWCGQPDVGDEWIALADAHPDAVAVQLGALDSDAAWKDRDGIARVIDRVHAAAGDTATNWRLARGRWLLEAPTTRAEDLGEAVKILTSVCQDAPRRVSPHLLLAQALQRLGMAAKADEELKLASAISGGSPYVALEQAQFALRSGDVEGARAHLDRALRAGDVPAALATRAAFLLSEEGEVSRGRDLLESLLTQRAAGPDGVLLLAKLYMKLGQPDRAGALYTALLRRPDPEIVELAADFFASTGNAVEAEKALALLDGMQLPAGDRELMRARHALNWDRAIAAGPWFAKAAEVGAAREFVWTQYVSYAVSTGDKAALERILDDPRAAGFERVAFLRSDRATCVAALDDVRLRPLLMAALDVKDARGGIMDAVRSMLRDWPDPAKRSDLARKIAGLADADVAVAPLQVLAADLCAGCGEVSRGVEIARRSMAQFPKSAPAARQAATLLAQRKQWDAALDAGRAWRNRAGRQDPKAELFVARVQIALDRPEDAANDLEFSLAAAQRDPEDVDLLLTYAVALVRAGKATKASEFLAGQVRRSERWRTIPLTLHVESDFDNAPQAKSWLQVCAGDVTADDAAARLLLARAWMRAWQKFHIPPFAAAAKELLAQLTASAGCPPEAWLVSGILAQAEGDVDLAKRDFQTALDRNPRLVSAHNNLAMILADAGEWKEAVEHAKTASTAEPTNAQYLETLAYSLRRGREFDKALAALGEAIRLEPTNASWRLSLAETLAESGKREDAQREAARAEQLVSGSVGPPVGFRKRMDELRIRLR